MPIKPLLIRRVLIPLTFEAEILKWAKKHTSWTMRGMALELGEINDHKYTDVSKYEYMAQRITQRWKRENFAEFVSCPVSGNRWRISDIKAADEYLFDLRASSVDNVLARQERKRQDPTKVLTVKELRAWLENIEQNWTVKDREVLGAFEDQQFHLIPKNPRKGISVLATPTYNAEFGVMLEEQ